jgi:hypothetical protein
MTDIPTYHIDAGRSGLNPGFSFAPSGGTSRRYKVLMFLFHRDRCHARCITPAIHDQLLSSTYCLCSLHHTTLEELSPD